VDVSHVDSASEVNGYAVKVAAILPGAPRKVFFFLHFVIEIYVVCSME